MTPLSRPTPEPSRPTPDPTHKPAGPTPRTPLATLLAPARTSIVRHVARVVLGLALLQAGIGHLTTLRQEFRAQVPPWLPLDPDFVVVASGIVEIALGLALIALPRYKVLLGLVAAAFFVAVFPGNVSQWQTGTDAFGLNSDTARVVRLLFQPLLVAWALWSTGAWRALTGLLRARNRPAMPLGSPAYAAGLLLRGRRVVAVGGGRVHARRVPTLLRAGAEVVVVAPRLHPDLAALAASDRITWQRRGFTEADLDGAWYVLAATDDPAVNARVAAEAEARRIFCVRADHADGGTAWTPATGEIEGATVAVLTDHDPRRAKALRDRLLASLIG